MSFWFFFINLELCRGSLSKMTTVLTFLFAAALLLQEPRNSAGQPSEPCANKYAYCRKPYVSNREHMRRMEGGQAEPTPPQDISIFDFKNYRCFCDPGCHVYGDCCLDAVTTMDPSLTLGQFEANVLTSRSKGLREWECLRIPSRQPFAMYMVGSCPAGYDDAAILNSCRRQVPRHEYDYTLDLPVLSQTTNLTYANVYCALCNDDTKLHPWNMEIHCPRGFEDCRDVIDSWQYVPGTNEWKHPNTSSLIYYAITNTILESEKHFQDFGVRKCHEDLITTCPADWKSKKEKMLCRSYHLIVGVEESDAKYKNEYCAICHGQLPEKTKCPAYLVYSLIPYPTPSYVILLDFLGKGSQVGGTGICESNGSACGFGELCDPLFQKCRPYTCGRLYKMDSDGKCVPKPKSRLIGLSASSKIHSTNDTSTHYHGGSQLPNSTVINNINITDNPRDNVGWSTVDSDCPKIHLTNDSFVRYSNDSIYVEATHQLLNGSQYELVNSTTFLVCALPEAHFSWKFSMAQSLLSKVCSILSILCLAAHIAIYAMIPSLRNLPGKNLLCLSTALLVAQICFECGTILTSYHQLCIGVGSLMHYGFLAAFFWMNVIAVDTFLTLATTIKLRSDGILATGKVFHVYAAYGWLMPLLIVLLAFTNDTTRWMPDYEPKYGEPLCWINNRRGLLVFFVLPLALLLVANVVLFTMTAIGIHRTRQSTEAARNVLRPNAIDHARLLLYVKLALIMGLTWVFGFVAALTNFEVLWYFFILLNCLQGAFIFIAFSCKKDVLSKIPKTSLGKLRFKMSHQNQINVCI